MQSIVSAMDGADTCSFLQTQIKLLSVKLRMPPSPQSLPLPAISQGGVEACWPSSPPSLIPGDTKAAPALRRSGNLSREKAVGEAELMAAWQAAGWLRGPGALLKMAAVKRCDVESHRAKARLPLAPSPPPQPCRSPSEDFVTCIRDSWSSD